MLGVEPSRCRHRAARSQRGATAAAALAELGRHDISPHAAVSALCAGGAAARRDRAGAGHRLPRPRPRRADQQPRHDDVRRLFDLIRRLQAAGSRDRLHLALHRGSEGGVGSVRRAARRPQRRRGSDRGAARRRDRQDDGGTKRRRSLSRAARATPGEALLQVDELMPGSASFAPAARRDSRHRRIARRGPLRACCGRFSASSR